MASLHVTLEQWRALQAVVDHDGFARAAEALHKSQSSVSYTVAKLQEQLGVSLLRVEGRKAVLTDEGKALLRRARLLLKQAEEVEQFAEGLEQGWESEINLVVDAAFPTDILMNALGRYAPQSHGCRVQLKEVVLSGAEDALLQGNADIAICANVPPVFLGEPLLNINFIAVSHIDHALHKLGRPLTTSDLEDELQLVINDSGEHHQQDVGWLGSDHRWSVSSMETALTTLMTGLGFCWLPEQVVAKHIEAGQIKPLDLEAGGQYQAMLYLVQGKQAGQGPGTKLLTELLHEEATRL